MLLSLSIPTTALAAGPAAVDTGTTAWMLTSTALVLLMVPGLAMFYGGLVRTKNVIGTMMHSFVSISIIGILWVVCGYSLAFGKNILGGYVGGNSDYFFLKGIDNTIVHGVPEYVLAMFQGKFAIITPALISGALTWMLIEAFVFRKVTSLGFVSGILAGLVAITPAAGVVLPSGAIILGALSSIACYLALNAKMKLGYDDSLDCFGIHGVGSGVGVLLLSFLVRDHWMAAARHSVAGWTYWNQFLVQLEGFGATVALAAVGTLAICFLTEKTVGFRIDQQGELDGLDMFLHSENGYGLIFPESR